MRFRSLYRYSYGKSPADLRPAIVACKVTLILATLAIVLFIVALFSFYYHHHLKSTDAHSSTSSSADNIIDTNSTTEPSTFDRQREQPDDHKSSSSSLPQYLTDYSGLICLVVGVFLFLLTGGVLVYAYFTYQRYLQSRLVAYQLVNRSFDQLQLEHLAKVHVRQPIVTKQNGGATVLVPKSSPIPPWLQEQSAPSSSSNTKPSKFAIWARSKWTRQNRANQSNNNNNPKRPISKDMTI